MYSTVCLAQVIAGVVSSFCFCCFIFWGTYNFFFFKLNLKIVWAANRRVVFWVFWEFNKQYIWQMVPRNHAVINSYKWSINLYYPTLLRRVQITRETSTNITRYLYSSYSPDRAKDQKPWQVRILGKRKRWARQNTALLVKIYSDTTH